MRHIGKEGTNKNQNEYETEWEKEAKKRIRKRREVLEKNEKE